MLYVYMFSVFFLAFLGGYLGSGKNHLLTTRIDPEKPA